MSRNRSDPPQSDPVAALFSTFGNGAQSRPTGQFPPPRPSLSERVAGRIIEMVQTGHLRTGDLLPTEQQMCVAFNVSRPPLREALKALVIMGLLESRQGGRYRVTEPSPTQKAMPFTLSLSRDDVDFHLHFEAREAVELKSVHLCAQCATRDERAGIVKLAMDGRDFIDHPEAFRLIDIEFHEAINRGSHNPLLISMGRFLYDVGLDARRVASTVPGVIEASVVQHIEIAEAISDGDAAMAVAGLTRHLEHVRDTAIQCVSMGMPR